MPSGHLSSGAVWVVRSSGGGGGGGDGDPVYNYGHKHQKKHKGAGNKHTINPPRPPVQDGVVVSFGPRDPSDDPRLPPNSVFTEWAVLPLTPQSLQVSAGAQWADGILPVRGSGQGAQGGGPGWPAEHAQFQGGMLDSISFSGRLEPPAFYIQANRARPISSVQSGQWGALALDAVLGGDGQWHTVEQGQVGGPVDVNAEVALEQRFFGTTLATPPTLPSGTDVVMSDGAVSPPGVSWHEPHVLCRMLEDACRSGEIVRLAMGDQYGYNDMISIRTFVWRVDDSDPDVIDFDLTARQHRPRPGDPRPPASHAKKHPPKSYVTKAGDTLHKVAHKELGDPSLYRRIVQYNRKMLERLWVYPDPQAIAPSYYPAGESYGPVSAGRTGRQVQTIAQIHGVGPDAYLRKGIRLSLAPKTKHKGR